jgi:hypothetical protein
MLLLGTLAYVCICITHLFTRGVEAKLVFPIEDERIPATGTITFLEEIRSQIINVKQTSQIGTPLFLHTESVEDCPYPSRLGISEFSDYGPRPVKDFQSRYIRSPGHADVTDVARFAYLDAYGARYFNGELQIVTNDEFHTVDDEYIRELSMYYESASYGMGLGDSAALAPPLRVRLMPVAEFQQEINDESKGCFCNMLISEGLNVVMGMVYYPQYGHSIYNGFSNFMANMWRNGFAPLKEPTHVEVPVGQPYQAQSADEEITFWSHLLRNTTSFADGVPYDFYSIMWHEAFDELVKIVAGRVHKWEDLLAAATGGPRPKICFKRIMVGARPDLDHLNSSVPDEMWDRFSRTLISYAFEQEIGHYLGKPNFDCRWDVISAADLMYFDTISLPRIKRSSMPDPPTHTYSQLYKSDCSVTIIVRENEGDTPKRGIRNVQELLQAARDMGCRAQTVRFQNMIILDQIEEVRWNTTLLVGSDGTGLLNALHMRPCSSVLRIEMWRKPGLIARLGPVKWIDYRPVYSDTIFVNVSDPIAIYLKSLEEQGHDMETVPLAHTPFENHEMEGFLRDGQAAYVRVDEFRSVVDASRLRIRQNDCT